MKTFATTDNTNDLYLDENKNIAVARDPRLVIKNLVQNKLQTFLGEIFTDNRIGVDYFGVILNENRPLQESIQMLTNVILSVPGVMAVEDSRYAQDKVERTVTFSFTILSRFGTINLNDLTLGT